MDQIEYLYFIPLLIYGIALSDIFSEYKRLLHANSHYWPYIILIFILSETAVYNVYTLYNLHKNLETNNYLQYWIFLGPPIIFMLAVNSIVLKDDATNKEKLEKHFKDRVSNTYLLMALYISSHLIPLMSAGTTIDNLVRIFFILVILLNVFSKKDWTFYFLVGLYFMSLILKFNKFLFT
jgi:hypothetical protein